MKCFIDGNAFLVHRYFQNMLQKEQIKVVYFGDHYWSDVHHAGNFNPYPEEKDAASKWDSIAVIEELQEHDKSLNDGKDPHLLKTERYWGPSYFTDEVQTAAGASSWWSAPAKTVKRNFFVAEAEKTARYALPFVRNISHFIR